MSAIRPPAVAGSFYPADRAALARTVDALLAEGRASATGRRPKALIVPHAGYSYSGAVAARGYRMLRAEGAGVTRAVVIGPAHSMGIAGIAAPACAAFETPLGRVPVDRRALDSLRELRQVIVTDAPHRREHAVEVQLPFLQRILGQFSLLPLVVGDAEPAEIAQVLARLWDGAETLVVVSSDLSHYHDYETARERDRATAAAIESPHGARLGPEDACGFLPIGGLLAETRRRGLALERLDLRNSGDTAGPRNRVVGYGAWALYDDQRRALAETGAA